MKPWARNTILVGLCLSLSLGPGSFRVAAFQFEDPPSVPLTPIYTPSDILIEHQEVFEQLFDMPFDPSQWTYPLQQQVQGVGSYFGANQFGQGFELRVLIATPVDLNDPALDVGPVERQWAIDQGFAYSGIIGRLKTRLANIPVVGLAVSQSNSSVPLESEFLLSARTSGDHPIFNPRAYEPGQTRQPSFTIPPKMPIPLFSVQEPDSPCTEACTDTYFADQQAAGDKYLAAYFAASSKLESTCLSLQATHDAAVAGAEAAYQIGKDAADATLAAVTLSATATLVAAHLLCALSIVVSLPCIIAASSVHMTAVGLAVADNKNQEIKLLKTLEKDKAQAQAEFDAGKELAESIFEIEEAAAEAIFNIESEAADQAYIACTDACNS